MFEGEVLERHPSSLLDHLRRVGEMCPLFSSAKGSTSTSLFKNQRRKTCFSSLIYAQWER